MDPFALFRRTVLHCIATKAWSEATATLQLNKVLTRRYLQNSLLTHLNIEETTEAKTEFIRVYLELGITAKDFIVVGRFFIRHGLDPKPMVAKILSDHGLFELNYFQPYTLHTLEVFMSLFETDPNAMKEWIDDGWEEFLDLIDEVQPEVDPLPRLLIAMGQC